MLDLSQNSNYKRIHQSIDGEIPSNSGSLSNNERRELKKTLGFKGEDGNSNDKMLQLRYSFLNQDGGNTNESNEPSNNMLTPSQQEMVNNIHHSTLPYEKEGYAYTNNNQRNSSNRSQYSLPTSNITAFKQKYIYK